jgi:arginase
VAVKIARQANRIAILGAPTSAAALSAGHENAPSALRKAALIERLASVGYQVNDLGDDPPQLYKPDEESPRARNLPAVIASLEALKPRVEQAIKSGALPLIMGGDCSIALATVAGARRYFRRVGVVYLDRDADLNTPSSTPSGCVDGMVVSHLTGRGAAELVRFWSEPPLVREPDLALFGLDRLDPSEEEFLRHSTLRRFMAHEVRAMGAAAAARAALDRIHANGYEFVLHFDVDVIGDFQATNYPASGGLTLGEVGEALELFLGQRNLAAVEVTAYNPTRDPDGSWANRLVDLLARGLENRLSALKTVAQPIPPEPAQQETAGQEAPAPPTQLTPESGLETPPPTPGEAWSPDSLEAAAPGQETETGASTSAPDSAKEPSGDSDSEASDSAERPAGPQAGGDKPRSPAEHESAPEETPDSAEDSGEPSA